MAVRTNKIHSPKEEMAELKTAIEHEKSVRRSLKISADTSYYQSQKEYLDQQIAAFQAKLAILNQRYEQSEALIAESHEREHKYRTRYLSLKHRDKILRIEQLKAEIEQLQGEI